VKLSAEQYTIFFVKKYGETLVSDLTFANEIYAELEDEWTEFFSKVPLNKIKVALWHYEYYLCSDFEHCFSYDF